MNTHRGASRWLDSLARRAARGHAMPLPIVDSSATGASGISRRTVLQTAAGAALVATPLRFLLPATATGAVTGLQACRADNFQRTYDAVQACVKDPLDLLSASQDAIAADEDHLAHVNELPRGRQAAARKRLKKNLANALRQRDRAIQQLEKCNADFLNERDGGDFDCQQANPPVVKSPPGGGGSGGGTVGCDTGYILCGDYCCNLTYATCVGCNSMPICCRINGNCCGSSG